MHVSSSDEINSTAKWSYKNPVRKTGNASIDLNGPYQVPSICVFSGSEPMLS